MQNKTNDLSLRLHYIGDVVAGIDTMLYWSESNNVGELKRDAVQIQAIVEVLQEYIAKTKEMIDD